MRTRASLLLLLVLTAATAQAEDQNGLDDAFARTTIVIEADQHACYHFEVYVAETFAQQRRGLMHVRQLPPRAGMLFVYDKPGRRTMWMKNTYVSLDMLFIRRDGIVASLAENTEPLSLATISSGQAVTYVLELNAGVADELGIGVGSRVHFEATR